MQTADHELGVLVSEASTNLSALIDSGALPTIPPINSLDTRLPQQSDRKVVKAAPGERFKIWANSDNSSKETWVDDIPNPNPGNPGQSVLLNYWDNGPAAQYTLTLRQYWQQVDGSYTQLPEGNSQTITVTHTSGISQTDAETLSAEVGASGGGLSAKLTATFSHSVTTSSEDTTSKQIAVEAPAAGKIRVWVAWQLVDEIVALDAGGNIIPADAGRKGEVFWNIMIGHSGAFMSYRSTQHAFPSNNVIYRQKDFDAPV